MHPRTIPRTVTADIPLGFGMTGLVSYGMAGKSARPAFNSFRRGRQVTIRLRLTSGETRRRRRLWRGKQVTVAPGIERGEIGSEEETDYATTE